MAAVTRSAVTIRVANDGTVAEGAIFAPIFTSFLTQTVQQLAAFAAYSLNITANALLGQNTAAAVSTYTSFLASYFRIQLQPLPIELTLGFDLLFRAQLSINGGDAASIQ